MNYYIKKANNRLYDVALFQAYFKLMKPRVMCLVMFTAFTGMIINPVNINIIDSVIGMVGIALSAGASASINMWYDRDIDGLMLRTKNRPIVNGTIPPDSALYFGIILFILSFFLLYLYINLISALLSSLAIFIYIIIYTIWLKRSSVQNIVIGGAAGAIPPIIGYTVGYGKIDLSSLSLFFIIFFWTPPHFWALSVVRKSEYELCNIPMMPIVKGTDYTNLLIIFYSIFTFIVSLLPFFVSFLGLYYFINALILGVMLIFLSIKLYVSTYTHYQFFRFSIIYLFCLFLSIIIDHYIVL